MRQRERAPRREGVSSDIVRGMGGNTCWGTTCWGNNSIGASGRSTESGGVRSDDVSK